MRKQGKIWNIKDDNNIILHSQVPMDPFQDGYIICKHPGKLISNYFCNHMGTVHGCSIAAWVDIVTSMAMYGFDKHSRFQSVSIDLSTDYISAATIGHDIIIKATIMKQTNKLGFT